MSSQVWVLDAWDDLEGKATIRVFSSREDAKRARDRFLEAAPHRYAGIVKRRVR